MIVFRSEIGSSAVHSNLKLLSLILSMTEPAVYSLPSKSLTELFSLVPMPKENIGKKTLSLKVFIK